MTRKTRATLSPPSSLASAVEDVTVSAPSTASGRRRVAAQKQPLALDGRRGRSRGTSVDLPPVIRELTLDDCGKAVSVVHRHY